MDELGNYQELVTPARVVGDVAFVAALCVTAMFERLQLRLRATESSKWWASNGRDVLNALAVGTMALGLKVIGFSGPIAFLLAATLVLLIGAVQASTENHRLSTALSVGVALLFGLPVLFVPAMVHSFLRQTLEILFLR